MTAWRRGFCFRDVNTSYRLLPEDGLPPPPVKSEFTVAAITALCELQSRMTTAPDAERERLENQIMRQQQEQQLLVAKLAALDAACGHVWTEPVFDPIYHPGYTIAGDAPGTMGVDYRGPMSVGSRTENRWKRTCSRCGKTEHTTNARSEQITKELPVW